MGWTLHLLSAQTTALVGTCQTINAGAKKPSKELATPHETDPGAFLAVNNDDDAGGGGPDGGNGVIDKNDSGPLPGPDPDLQSLHLVIKPIPDDPYHGTVTLDIPASTKVWTDKRKTREVPAGSWDLSSKQERAAFLQAIGARRPPVVGVTSARGLSEGRPEASQPPGGRGKKNEVTSVDVELAVERLERGSGNIELTYSSIDDDVEDAVKVNGVKVDILDVPTYFYAAAPGHVPVKFKVTGANSVFIKSIEGRFVADRTDFGEMQPLAFAQGNGWGGKGNGTTNTYTAWFDKAEFAGENAPVLPGVQIKATDNIYFTLEVEVKKTDGESVMLLSDMADADARPEAFWDKQWQAIPLGRGDEKYSERVSLNRNVSGRKAFMHTDRSDGASQCTVDPEAGTDLPNQTETASHLCAKSDCYGPALSSSSEWFDTARIKRSATSRSRKLRIYISNSDIRPGEWNEIQAKHYGEKVGMICGVSYGLSEVQELDGAWGRNLDMYKGEVQIDGFKGAKVVAGSDDVASSDKIGIALKASAFTLSVAAGVTTGGASTVLTIAAVGASGATTIYEAISDKDNEEHNRAQGFVRHNITAKPLGVAPISETTEMVTVKGDFSIPNDSTVPFKPEEVTQLQAGATFSSYVTMGLVVNEQEYMYDETEAWIEWKTKTSIEDSRAIRLIGTCTLK